MLGELKVHKLFSYTVCRNMDISFVELDKMHLEI